MTYVPYALAATVLAELQTATFPEQRNIRFKLYKCPIQLTILLNDVAISTLIFELHRVVVSVGLQLVYLQYYDPDTTVDKMLRLVRKSIATAGTEDIHR